MRIGRAAWRVGLAALVLTVLIAAWAARFYGLDLVRALLVREVWQQLGAELRLDGLALSLVPPELAADGVELLHGGQTLITVRRIEFRLAALRSLWGRAWIGDLRLAEPRVVANDRTDAWRRIESSLRSSGTSAEDPVFLPRSLSVTAGRLDLDWSRFGARASIDRLDVEAQLGGLVRRRFDFTASTRVVMDRGGHRLELRRVAAKGRVSTRGVAVDSAAIDGTMGALRGSFGLEGEDLRGELESDLTLDPVFALVPEAGVVVGAGRVTARLRGTLDRPEIRADLEARKVRIDNVEFSGRGQLTSSGTDWKLAPARAEMFGGIVDGTASGKLSGRVPFEVQARFRNWNPATFVKLFGVRTPLRGAWSGDARIRGDLFGDDLQGGGRFALEEGPERLTGAASFTVVKDAAEVEGSIEAGPQDRLRARFRVLEHTKIAGEVDGESRRLDAFGRFVGLRLEGAGEAQARFFGTVDQPVFSGAGEFEALAVNGIVLGRVRGPFEISADGLRSAGVEIADGEIAASGRIALSADQRNDWSATARGASLKRAIPVVRRFWPTAPDLDGTFDGGVKVDGNWSRLGLRGRGHVKRTNLAGEGLGDGDVEVSLDAGQWSGAVSLRRDDGALISLRAAHERDDRVSGAMEASGWRVERLAWLRQRWPDLHGRGTLSATLGGTLTKPRGEASLRIAGLALADRSIGDAALRFTADGQSLRIDGSLAPGAKLSATSWLERPYPFRMRVECQDTDLAPFLLTTPDLGLFFTGEGEISGDLQQPLGRGEARIASLRVGSGAGRLENRTPIVMRVAAGRVEIPATVLEGRGQRVTVGGHWTEADAAFQAAVKGDLALLESFRREIASARGSVDAEISGSRHGARPWTYRGQARLIDGAFDLAFVVGVTDVSGFAEIDDRKVELRDLAGKLGGGDFLVNGSLSIDGGWDLGWAIRDASLGVPSWLDYRAGGTGRLVGPLAAPTFSGEIEVAQAVYDRRIEWAEFLPWFRKQTRPGPGGSRLPLTVDLRLVADGGLFVDNNLAKSEMRGDLRLRGGPESLALSGTIDVLSGEFTFRRRRFTITSGTIQFFEDRPTNPDLRLSGETHVDTRDEEYEIQINVSGTADSPRIQFTADDPALTENDVLALVTFGHTVAQLQSQGAGIELGEVLALTTGPEAGQVEQEIHTFLPVDRIEIEPSFSRVNGARGPRLSIAKELLVDRLSAVIGTGLGSERSQDVGLEYQFTRRFSLQGGWESQTKSEAGAFAVNFKFRLPFRTVPRFSLLPRSFSSAGSP